MNLVAAVVDPLTEPVPPSWDAFVTAERLLPVWSSRILLGADWCAQAASSMVLVEEASSAVPIAVFHARHLGATAPTRFARPGRMPMVTVTECRIVPGVLDAGMAFAATTTTPDRIEAVRVFERAMRRRTRRGGLAIAYRELEERHVVAVPAAGRVRLRLSPRMVLYNEWSDLTSYLASLPSKWRSQLKKIYSDVHADPTIRVDLVETIDPADACWLAELGRRRHAPRAIRRPPLTTLYFEQLAALPETRFLTYRDADGRLLGFATVLDSGSDLILINWSGRSTEDGGRSNLYFDQYRHLIGLMIDMGRQRLVMGKGLQEIKARYGARAEPLWALVGLP